MKPKLLFTFALATGLQSPGIRAEEAGSGHYLPGATASFIDALPGREAFAYVNMFTYYNGSAGGARQLNLGANIVSDIDATVYADTSVLLYWTFEPGVSVSWLSSKIGTEVSLFAGYDFRTKNDKTDYQSGDVFHLDATVAQHLPLLGGFVGLGANAFYYQQVTDDRGTGAKLGGFEGRTMGVGPVLSYATKLARNKKTDLVAELKWLPELDVEHRLTGDTVWFKLALLF